MILTHPRLIRFVILMVVFLLALPVGIGMHTLTQADLQRQFNRAPTPMPALSDLGDNPAAAIHQTVRYYSDRMAGVATTTQTLQRLRFEWLGDPASPMIARRDELVFLSSFGALRPPMTNMRDSCRVADVGGDPWLATLMGNTRTIYGHLKASGRKIGFLIVPSKQVLYHDMLPHGTPTSFRALCLQAATNGDLTKWEVNAATNGIAASYPLNMLNQGREDPAYYPAGNFHAEGASAHDATVSLMDKLYPNQRPWPGVTFHTIERDADLEYLLTFPRTTPMRMPDYGIHAAIFDQAATDALRAQNPAFRHAQVFGASTPIIGGTAVIIGNSFAKHAAPNVAPYYAQTIMFGMAGASDEELTIALRDLVADADAVIFLVQDTAAKHWLWQRERDILDALNIADKAEPARQGLAKR